MDEFVDDGEERGVSLNGAGAVSAPSEVQGGHAAVALDEVEASTANGQAWPTPQEATSFDDNPPLAPEGSEVPARAASAPPWELSTDGIDPSRILLDRPDVFQGFYSAYYGPENDHRSHAWADRVGDATPEAYALYWYKTYAFWEGYRPSTGEATPDPQRILALLDPAGGERTTADGVPLNQILSERPDVFQAFYREFYGPGVDHHSSAWANRVGGATPQDYANYWYEAHGKAEGYAPQQACTAPPLIEMGAATSSTDEAGGYFVT